MVRYQFVSPRYQLDPSNSTKERKNGIFLKSYSFSKKIKGVPLPFLKTLLDSFLCDETNERNALIQSLSRPKTCREWQLQLSFYVSEPTNLNPNISNIINRKHAEDLKPINRINNQLLKTQNLSLSPKSGSHHHKNIYPQFTKAKSI